MSNTTCRVHYIILLSQANLANKDFYTRENVCGNWLIIICNN